MKKLMLIPAMLLVAVSAFSAPPAPGNIGVSPNTPFTDTTTVTNAAVSLPVGNFTNSVIYAPSKSLKGGLQVTWSASAGASGYALYYGDLASTPTKFDVAGNTSAVFFSLNTNLVYYFYVTAYDATKTEGVPSGAIIAKPGS